ncbi:hypothetical protein LWI29_035395 [Acer saccharum]|uniref:PGG domain-containing protein n=1 Tax=Acer saccharum TaxID=4024 RepID=A0AA39T2T0_ACESA|nr:hypothetical protein LWI29_035395 [Acer saccharum]
MVVAVVVHTVAVVVAELTVIEREWKLELPVRSVCCTAANALYLDSGSNDVYVQRVSRSEQYFKTCVPLRKAALKGNFKEFKNILNDQEKRLDTSLLRMPITKGRATILHVAAGARQKTFVKEIIKSIEPWDQEMVLETLLIQDPKGQTSFCFAAAAGDVEIAKIMVNRIPNLNKAILRDQANRRMTQTPLYQAVMFGRKEMASYLYEETENFWKQHGWEQKEINVLFFMSISTDLYDMALKLLNSHPELAVSRNEDNDETALHMLARKPKSMTSQALELVRCLWEKVTTKQDTEVEGLITRPTKLWFDAAKSGNSKFLALVVGSYPDLILRLDENDSSIFHIAISRRHTNIFKLIYEMGFDKVLLAAYEDCQGNNILHLAGKFPNERPASIVPGAALEMQRELLLFEAVEMIVQPSLRDVQNLDGDTPKKLFTTSHKDLQKRGEQWMKTTAKSCMLVATLIATVVFAAAFTIPGGNNQQVGRPIYLDKTFFKVFAASDAIALSSSSISIMIFLSILTSRYEEEDFRMWLPLKLMFGLLTLFISVISMTIAFSSAFFLFYPSSERLNWITMSTAVLVSVPVTLYVGLQYSLLKDIFCSTFCSRYQFKPK